jgi:hypothetical protein
VLLWLRATDALSSKNIKIWRIAGLACIRVQSMWRVPL